jgi:hypothetical protein
MVHAWCKVDLLCVVVGSRYSHPLHACLAHIRIMAWVKASTQELLDHADNSGRRMNAKRTQKATVGCDPHGGQAKRE